MKHNKFFPLIMALTLGFYFVGCPADNNGGTDVLDGTTWVGKGFDYDGGPHDRDYKLTFNSPDWIMERGWGDGGNIVKGTYSVSENNVIFTTTNQWDEKGASWKPATGSFLPQSGTFTDTEMTIKFTPGDNLVYTKN